jgi:hypothetical protein
MIVTMSKRALLHCQYNGSQMNQQPGADALSLRLSGMMYSNSISSMPCCVANVMVHR